MKNFIKKTSIILSSSILIGGILFPIFANAASFNNDSSDYPILQVGNSSRNPGCTTCWVTSLSANDGEYLSFLVYYHNTSASEVATQTRVRVNLPSSNFTSANISADVWAQNANTVSGSVNITIPSNLMLAFVPGSVRWFPNRSNNPQPILLNNQLGNEIISSSGLNIGDIAPGWDSQGYITFKVKVGSTSVATQPTGPSVTTGATTFVSSNSINFNGTVNPNNANTTVWFEYGPTRGLGYTTASQSLGSGNSVLSVAMNVSISPSTPYFYRIVASNANGANYGDVMVYSPGGISTITSPGINIITGGVITGGTMGNVPIVRTLQPAYVFQSSALLSGTFNPNGAVTNVWFEWGTTDILGNTTQSIPIGDGYIDQTTSFTLSGLNPGAIYYYRAVAQNVNGIRYGNILNFRTQTTAAAPIAPYTPSVYYPSRRPSYPSYTPIQPAYTAVLQTAVSGLILIPAIDNSNPRTGDEINLTVVYKNNSSQNITNAVLTVIVPTEVDYDSANPAPNSVNGNNLTFNIGNIDGQKQGSITVKTTVKSGTAENTALVYNSSMTFTDNKGKIQIINAYITAVVKTGGAFLASLGSTLGSLFGNWAFDLLFGILVGWGIYKFFIRSKENELAA